MTKAVPHDTAPSGPELRIGDLAAQVGVSVSAIRFYEGKGLLEPDGRSGGQRRYTPDAVERLRLVATFRSAGLSISDIAVALDRDPGRAEHRRRQAVERASELREQLRTTVSALVVVDHASYCHRDPDDTRCIGEIVLQRERALQQAQHLLDGISHLGVAADHNPPPA